MFFIISSLIMGAMVWLIYQEFFTRRPWADVQADWYKVQEQRARVNLQSEETWLKEGVLIEKDEDGEEEEVEVGPMVEELTKTINTLKEGIVNSPEKAAFDQLGEKIKSAQIEVKDAEMAVAFAKADEDEYYYYYRRDKHKDDAEGEKKHREKVEQLQKRVADKQVTYDEKVAVRDKLLDEKAKIIAKVREAELKLNQLRSKAESAKRTFAKAESEANSLFPREMMQHWNQDIELVDRCHTCHMGSEKCGYSYPKEILEDAVTNSLTAEDVQKKYCISREEAVAYADNAESIRDSFGEDEELNYDSVKAELLLDMEPVLDMGKKLGLEQYVAESLYRTHPNRTVLLRKHPGGTFGCTTCHYGQGRQTKGVALNLLKGDTAPFTHATRDHYWLSQILDPVRRADGTKPENKHFTEASCYNCHKSDYELEAAPHLTEARKLVQHLGCTGCHPLGTIDPERKHGPALQKVASKINPGWLAKWIEYPKAMRPRTRMPNFWPEAVRKTPDGERKLGCNEFDYKRGAATSPAVAQDCDEKRTQEVAYITYYLLDKSERPDYPAMPKWANAEAGQEVFEATGCIACHNLNEWTGASHLPGSEDRDIAPNLANIGDKIANPGWFFEWVKNPKSYWHETRMPKLNLTDKQAWNVAAYLSSLKSGEDFTQLQAEYKEKYITGKEEEAKKRGEVLVKWYGCAGCHDVAGHENDGRIGAELIAFGSKPSHKLDFGDVPEFTKDHHSQTWEGWTRRKLYDPRSYRYERAEVRMPQFDLTERENDLITLFLRGQNLETEGWPDEIRKQHTPNELAVQRGAFLVDAYNCRGCHMIDGRGIDIDGDHVADGGDIYKWFAANEDEMYRAPPKLVNIGKKLYPDWLYAFLKEPFKLRENFKVKMPNFQFTDQMTSDLVAYFASKSNSQYPYVEKKVDVLSDADIKTAEALFTASQCLNCHNLGGPSNDPKNIAPNLALTADRLQYEWLFDWLKDPASQIPGVGMPGFFIYDEDEDDYMTPLTQYADGDWKRQVELLRAYVISLGAKKNSKYAKSNSDSDSNTASLRD